MEITAYTSDLKLALWIFEQVLSQKKVFSVQQDVSGQFHVIYFITEIDKLSYQVRFGEDGRTPAEKLIKEYHPHLIQHKSHSPGRYIWSSGK